MSGFSEAHTVQAWLVERLVEQGWTYVPGDKLARERTDVLVEDTLIEQLEVLNNDLHGFPERVDEVLPEIRARVLAAATDGLVPANEAMVTLLRGDHTVKYVGTDKYVPLRLIDFENLGENDYVVSDEVTFGPPGRERRYDVVLWVNGIPLVVIETKTPVNSSVSWLNGARDIANVYSVEGRRSSLERVVCGDGWEGVPLRRGRATGRALAHVGVHARPVLPGRDTTGASVGGVVVDAGAAAVDSAGLHPV